MKNKIYLFLCCSFFFIHPLFSQVERGKNAAEILLEIEKLNTLGSVLYIAAHPDDENTRLLTYLANEKKYRTGYLALTRGDGGQNLIGKEQGEALGLIRTQELLAARRNDGAEQFFTRANDFGYSKHPEETFSIWEKEEILSDVVWVIRNFKPDVIVCRFPTTGEGGHGHHTASAILAEEAFEAAADSTRFSEQLAYVETWQPQRLFWNTFQFGDRNTTSSKQLHFDIGQFNPLLGKSYGEIAAESRSMHKSQGFGSAKERGEIVEYFKQIKGEEAKESLLENINTQWSRISGGQEIQLHIDYAIQNFDLNHPEKSISDLAQIYQFIDALEESSDEVVYWKKQKLAAVKELIVECSGLWMEATASDYYVTAGDEVEVTAHAIARNTDRVVIQSIQFLTDTPVTVRKSLKQNKLYAFEQDVTIHQQSSYSGPYWLKENHRNDMYIVNHQQDIGKPEKETTQKVHFVIEVEGLELEVVRPFVYKSVDPVKGEVYRPFEVLPPATVNLSNEVLVFGERKSQTIVLKIKANKDYASGEIQVEPPAGWNVELERSAFKLTKKGDEMNVKATLTPEEHGKSGALKVALMIGGEKYNKSITRIEYDHIPYQFYLKDARAKIVYVEVEKLGNSIGYIPGAGDNVAKSLEQIGYLVTVLDNEKIEKENLSKYDAIVTGIRAFNVNDRLFVYYDKLMEYVKQGGNLVVQYNTNSRFGPLKGDIGPYPFTITHDRVTDEEAEVVILDHEHPVVNFPNKITEIDFEDWVQERGLYFAEEDVDERYQQIFSMHDPDEKGLKGSVITAPYGKGNYVYTGLAFFRELPAGIPGAYRLFVNLLSLPTHE